MLADRRTKGRPEKHTVLVLSSDPVAAALVGGLVETLGYAVRFYESPEDPILTLKRERPDVAMIDGADHLMISDAVLGNAAMRNIDVVIFGSQAALNRIRDLALAHDIHTLIAPPTAVSTSDVLSGIFAARR